MAKIVFLPLSEINIQMEEKNHEFNVGRPFLLERLILHFFLKHLALCHTKLS